ncbi:erkA [Symbiodinium sp. CCMP2456]|nr:erkA [Symbiodinium sp. CCMP2456]
MDMKRALHLQEKKTDLDAAVSSLTKSLKMQRARMATTLHELGLVCMEKGDLDAAASHLTESLSLMRAVHGKGVHREVAFTLHDLGVVFRAKGDLDAAASHLTESLSMKRAVYGQGSRREVAFTLHELGVLFRAKGDLDASAIHLTESLTMMREVHGEGAHGTVAITLHELGMVYMETGDLDAAASHLTESLSMKRAVYGQGAHREVATTLHELGVVFRAKGDLDAAASHLTKSLSLMREVPEEGAHGKVAMTLQELGMVYMEKGDLDAAASHLTESLSMKRAVYGHVANREVALTLHKLGVVCKEKGDLDASASHPTEKRFGCSALQLEVRRQGLEVTRRSLVSKAIKLVSKVIKLMSNVIQLVSKVIKLVSKVIKLMSKVIKLVSKVIKLVSKAICEQNGVTYFAVDVTHMTRGTWRVLRRYRNFDQLRYEVNVRYPFPGKHWFGCTGANLEARRRGLEAFTNYVALRFTHHGVPAHLNNIMHAFLENGAVQLAAPPAAQGAYPALAAAPSAPGASAPLAPAMGQVLEVLPQNPTAPAAPAAPTAPAAPAGPVAPPAAPAAPAPPTQQQLLLSIPVPDGVKPGQLLGVRVPDGRELTVTVPPNCGQQLQVAFDPSAGSLTVVDNAAGPPATEGQGPSDDVFSIAVPMGVQPGQTLEVLVHGRRLLLTLPPGKGAESTLCCLMASICVEVSLLSGRTAKITREAQCSLEEFKQEALETLEMCAGVLLTTSGELLCQGTLEGAGLKDGDVVLLQQRQADILDSLELDCQLSHRRGASIQAPERFAILDLVAQGAYGVVCSARDEITADMVAIKKMRAFESNMGALDVETLRNARQELKELRLLRHFHHENILDLRYVFFPGSKMTFQHLYSVSELMETDLQAILKSSQSLLDQHCQFFSYQILRGLKFMHSAGVRHQDLKPRVLLVNRNCDLKISGLSLAALGLEEIGEGLPRYDEYPYVANQWYRAPEALCHCTGNVYGPAIDIWGVGVILGEMFARRPVFPGKNVQHQLTLILQGLGLRKEESSLSWIKKPEMRKFVESLTPSVNRKAFCDALGPISPSAMELLDALLQFDPQQRVSAEQALNWSYFGEFAGTDLRCPEDMASSEKTNTACDAQEQGGVKCKTPPRSSAEVEPDPVPASDAESPDEPEHTPAFDAGPPVCSHKRVLRRQTWKAKRKHHRGRDTAASVKMKDGRVVHRCGTRRCCRPPPAGARQAAPRAQSNHDVATTCVLPTSSPQVQRRERKSPDGRFMRRHARQGLARRSEDSPPGFGVRPAVGNAQAGGSRFFLSRRERNRRQHALNGNMPRSQKDVWPRLRPSNPVIVELDLETDERIYESSLEKIDVSTESTEDPVYAKPDTAELQSVSMKCAQNCNVLDRLHQLRKPPAHEAARPLIVDPSYPRMEAPEDVEIFSPTEGPDITVRGMAADPDAEERISLAGL